MGRNLNNHEGPFGSMQCAPDLADRVRQGMGCEVEVVKGGVVWKPCGPSRARSHSQLSMPATYPDAPRVWRCPDCRLEFVRTLDVVEYDNDGDRAVLTLICGNCNWSNPVEMTLDEANDLQEVNDLQFAQMCSDLRNAEILARLEWSDRFICALQEGRIGPQDF